MSLFASHESPVAPARPQRSRPRRLGGMVGPDTTRVIAVAIVGVLLFLGAFRPLQSALENVRFSLSSRAPTRSVVLVDIDEPSIHDIGVWPWNRSIHAAIVDRLRSWQASDIAFDVDFSARSTPDGDAAFEAALKRADGSVILAALQQQSTLGTGVVAILQSHPLARFLDHAWEGSVNVRPDSDGQVRWFPRGELFGDVSVPALAGLLLPGTAPTSGDFKIDYGIEAAEIDRVPVVDLLHGAVDPQRIAGKKVIVGASAVELRDFFQVPRFGVMSGPLVQAMAAESLLQGRALQPLGSGITVVLTTLLLGLLGLAARRLSMLGAIALSAGASVAAEATALAVQTVWPVIPVTAPLHAGLLAFSVIAVGREIVDRRAHLQASRRNANRLRTILDRVITDNFAGIVVVDQEGLVRAVNVAATRLLGVRIRADDASPFGEVLPDPLAALVAAAVRRAEAGDRTPSAPCEVKLSSNSGADLTLDCLTRVSEVGEPSERHRVEVPEFAVCLTFQDVTEQRRVQAKLAAMAHVDALSGLANRYVFLTRLGARHAQGSNGATAVLLLDLDRFKLVNDRLGHAAGDTLIQGVAARLRTLVAPGDVAARLGGDEFALLFARETTAEVETVAGSIAKALGGSYALGAYQVAVVISAGLAFLDHHDVKETMNRADAALYAAKAAGGGRVQLYDAAMKAIADDGKLLESDLREAVQRQAFEVVYQRQVDAGTEAIVGVEALVRWKHPVRGYISPATFIPVAERTGLIEPIGAYVLSTACRDAATWPVPIKVSVNLSAVQLARADLSSTVLQALAASSLDPSRLDLELTETLLMDNDAIIQATLGRLRAIGIKISLDDFGTGYSSLSYLKSFAIDKVKIDQSFVRDLASDRSSPAIIRAVVGLSRDLGLRVNAEGVETREQLALLRGLGCDEVQGYLHGRPEPSAAITTSLLEQRNAGRRRCA